MSEPPLGQKVRDRSGRVWRSWDDALGIRLWGVVGNDDADPITWSLLERKYGPLVIF